MESRNGLEKESTTRYEIGINERNKTISIHFEGGHDIKLYDAGRLKKLIQVLTECAEEIWQTPLEYFMAE